MLDVFWDVYQRRTRDDLCARFRHWVARDGEVSGRRRLCCLAGDAWRREEQTSVRQTACEVVGEAEGAEGSSARLVAMRRAATEGRSCRGWCSRAVARGTHTAHTGAEAHQRQRMRKTRRAGSLTESQLVTCYMYVWHPAEVSPPQ